MLFFGRGEGGLVLGGNVDGRGGVSKGTKNFFFYLTSLLNNQF